MTIDTNETIDLGPSTPVYGTKNTEVGVDETDSGYIKLTTAQGITHTFSVDKEAVEEFVEKMSAESGPTLEPPEDAPADIESPPGWKAGIKHTGGGIWAIIFEKAFNGNRIEVTIDADTPDGVAVGGYENGVWMGEITHIELDEPEYETALQTARNLIEQIEDGELDEEVEEIFD